MSEVRVQFSDMESVAAAVRGAFEALEPGTPVASSRLVRCGNRAAVDQALTRLVRSGFLKRAARGVYYRPAENRFVGSVPPSTEAVVSEIAHSRGETVVPHPVHAALAFGLTTQVPMRAIWLTDGRTRSVTVGGRKVELRHAAPSAFAHAGTLVGQALSALRYVGPTEAPIAVKKVRSKLAPEDYETLRQSTQVMPGWLSAQL